MERGDRPDGSETGVPVSETVDGLLREVARSPPVRALPRPGQVLAGKYRVERLLGRGGMGAVFAAHHELLQQSVALKVMLADPADSRQSVPRFLNEARAAARIEGEHVARVLDVGQLDDGSPYIAMELLEGSDLAHLLATRGSLPADEAIEYVLQALQALAQAHALGIVHRDLKPANLFLARRRDGTEVVKVLDFGISKVIDPGASPGILTGSSSLLGSPLYMAPEQLRHAKTVDPRADIWAIGVILFELLAGRPPFDGKTLAEVFAAILERPPAALRTVRPDLPAGLEAIITRCLAREPSDRFSDVAELAQALGAFAPPHAQSWVQRVSRLLPRAGAKDAAMRGAVPQASSGFAETPSKGAPATLETVDPRAFATTQHSTPPVAPTVRDEGATPVTPSGPGLPAGRTTGEPTSGESRAGRGRSTTSIGIAAVIGAVLLAGVLTVKATLVGRNDAPAPASAKVLPPAPGGPASGGAEPSGAASSAAPDVPPAASAATLPPDAGPMGRSTPAPAPPRTIAPVPAKSSAPAPPPTPTTNCNPPTWTDDRGHIHVKQGC
jgi:serine/threonine-protein kinase